MVPSYITKQCSIALASMALATCACCQSSYLQPVPAVPKLAILIMTSFAPEAWPWALGVVYRRTDAF